MKNNLLLLINDLLCERRDYISTRDIHNYASLHGCNLERDDKFQKNSVRQQITQAKNKLKACLSEHGLHFEEIPDKEDGRITCFRYPSAIFEREIDLVAKYRDNHKNLRRKQIEEMLTYSKGLLPKKIMAEIFIKELDKRKRTIIEFESHDLKNIHLLSELFLAILHKKVVTFDYVPFASDASIVVLHPHYLKEYNNRWFIFGQSISKNKTNPTAIYSLDRIVNGVKILEKEEYIASTVNYETYFDGIIGVSKIKKRAQKIVFRTNDKRTHGRILTKKIHRTQKQIDDWNDTEQCGRFEITVRANYELKAKLLSFGSGITLENPEWYVSEIAKEIKQMYRFYSNYSMHKESKKTDSQ